MKLSLSREWFMRMAEKEDGCCVSAGGFWYGPEAQEQEAEVFTRRDPIDRAFGKPELDSPSLMVLGVIMAVLLAVFGAGVLIGHYCW